MTPSLRIGDSDPRVAEVRATLTQLGFIAAQPQPGSTPQFSPADTLFDPALQVALAAFQQARGMIAHGEIDDATLRVLREASFSLGERDLAYQPDHLMAGDDVTQLQDQLHELGFYSGRIDGLYGPDTEQAVKSYQLNYGLNIDGIAGANTLRALSYLGLRVRGGSAQAIREREQVRLAGPRLTGKKVIIDPAFGGSDTGLVVEGPFGPISEEEICWDLAERIRVRCQEAGMEAMLTRPRMHNPSVQERTEMANAFGADVMISIQCDRYQNEKASGVASFYFGSTMGQSSLVGEKLSGFIQREIVARTPLINCGNHARTWDLLRLTHMPTVEVVAGYLTNPGDVAVLTDPEQRDAIAEAIVVAVKRLYLLDNDDKPTGTYKFADIIKQELLG